MSIGSRSRQGRFGQHSRLAISSQPLTADRVFLLFCCLVALLNIPIFFQFHQAPRIMQRELSYLNGRRMDASDSIVARPERLPPSYRLANFGDTCSHHQSLNFVRATNEKHTMEHKVDLDNQREFANGGYEKIAKGSGNVLRAGPILTLLSKLQHEQGIFGSVAELGVHHGRFTGFLFVTARKEEQLVVGDLFEELQYKNVDKSGLGDRRRFMKGLVTYGLKEQDLHTVFVGSTDELPFDWPDKAGFNPFRLISVDASHTAELVFNDLQIAFCNLLKGGIVIMDDWYNSVWPGVVEGFYQFVTMGPLPSDDIFPFLACDNKLFVTNHADDYELYYNSLLNDPNLRRLLTPYAHEKERGKLLYEMNGVKYLKCHSGVLNSTTEEFIHQVWANSVY